MGPGAVDLDSEGQRYTIVVLRWCAAERRVSQQVMFAGIDNRKDAVQASPRPQQALLPVVSRSTVAHEACWQ